MQDTIHVHLLYNPKAGDERQHKEQLLDIIEAQGFTCQHASIKEKGWHRFSDKTVLVVVVGGDGTVREVMKKLMNRRILDRRLAVALLPGGTANNFAKTLGISSELTDFAHCLSTWQTKCVDVGAVSNLRGSRFFIEGLGCGIIPRLIDRMKDVDLADVDTAGKELAIAMEKLQEIVMTYPAKHAKILVDGHLYEGDYLLIEVLNIRSVGPNVILAPQADPTDGALDVVLIKEGGREAFADYLRRLQQEDSSPLSVPWEIVKATRTITIRCEHRLVHVDDELVAHRKGERIKIEVRPGVVDFIT